MKKLILFLSLGMFPVLIFAQGTEVGEIDWGNFKDYFLSLTTLSTLVIALSAIVIKWIKKELTPLIKQLISLGIALVLALIGWLFGWGLFEGVAWWQMLLYGVAAGFGSNGGWDLIKAILRLVELIPKKK